MFVLAGGVVAGAVGVETNRLALLLQNKRNRTFAAFKGLPQRAIFGTQPKRRRKVIL